MRLLDMIFRRHTSGDERSRRGQEIDALQARADTTLDRADRALRRRQRLASELDGAVAAFRRPR